MTSAIRFTDFAAVAGGAPKMVLHNGGRAAAPVNSSQLEGRIEWNLLVRARRNCLASGIRPSSIEVVAWNAVQATRRQSIGCESVGVGAAVVTELSNFPAFCEAVRKQVQAVRDGCTESRIPQLQVSLEAPDKTRTSRLVLTFDRDILDAPHAARLLRDVAAGVASHQSQQ
jgi:hypothetical protein